MTNYTTIENLDSLRPNFHASNLSVIFMIFKIIFKSMIMGDIIIGYKSLEEIHIYGYCRYSQSQVSFYLEEVIILLF